jgi:hypothetical protein
VAPALGVGPTTRGTSVLRGRILHGEQGERMRQKDPDPARREKIAASKRGKRLVAATLLQQLQVELATGQGEAAPVALMSLRPRGDVRLRWTRREAREAVHVGHTAVQVQQAGLEISG